jgi:uroporphyrinogen decarboxylase
MHDMMDHLAEFYAGLYDQVLTEVSVDSAVFWEDMCYVAGPMISPATFREFMLDPYRKVTEVLRDRGVRIVIVDTDGDHRLLTPVFLEAGVTGFYPFEVQSHMDVVETREKYPNLIMQGGIDKKALATGKHAIDLELDRKVPVALSGGYIPHVDHAVPPDVSWENFCYYRRKLDAMLDEYESNGYCG